MCRPKGRRYVTCFCPYFTTEGLLPQAWDDARRVGGTDARKLVSRMRDHGLARGRAVSGLVGGSRDTSGPGDRASRVREISVTVPRESMPGTPSRTGNRPRCGPEHESRSS